MHCLRGQRWWCRRARALGLSQPTEAHQIVKEETVGWRGGGTMSLLPMRLCWITHTHTHTHTEREHRTLVHSTQLAGIVSGDGTRQALLLPSRGNWARLPTRWKHSATLFPLLPLSLLVTFTLLVYFGAAKENRMPFRKFFRWRWNQT